MEMETSLENVAPCGSNSMTDDANRLLFASLQTADESYRRVAVTSVSLSALMLNGGKCTLNPGNAEIMRSVGIDCELCGTGISVDGFNSILDDGCGFRDITA